MSIVAWIVMASTVFLMALLPTGAIPQTLVGAAAVLSLAAALVTLAGRRPDPPQTAGAAAGRGRWTAWTLAAMLVLLGITLIPLPYGISPFTGATRHAHNAAVAEAVESVAALELIAPVPHRFALTRNTSGTARVALLAAAAIGAVYLASRLGRRGRMLYLRFLVAIGAAVAALGYLAMKHHPQGDNLWWILPVPHGLPGPIACFRNPNHFAAFLALLCPPALALGLHDLAKIRPVRATLDFAAFALMSVAIVYSLSRGTLLSYGVGLAACALILFIHRRWIRGGVMLAVGVAAVTAILSISHPVIRDRLHTLTDVRATDSYQTRVAIWSDCRAIFRHYPILGVGANGFRMVYPQHRTTSQGAQITSHAENEYVQLAVDGGLAGIALAMLLLAALSREAFLPALRQAHDLGRSTIALAALGAVVVAAVHALVDYALHIPLYAVPLASLLGLLLPPDFARPAGATPVHRVRHAAPALLCASVGLVLVLVWGNRLHFDSAYHLRRADLNELARALAYSPSSTFAWYDFGDEVGNVGTPEARFLANNFLGRAGELDPNNYRLWNRIGLRREQLGYRREAAQAFGRVKALRDWFQVPFLPEDLP